MIEKLLWGMAALGVGGIVYLLWLSAYAINEWLHRAIEQQRRTRR